MASADAGGGPPEGGRPALRLERTIMAGSMGLLCLITMGNVVVRYFTDISFAFTEEISIALMVVMTLTGAAHAFVDNRHIAITYFIDRLGPRGHRTARGIALLATLAMFVLLATLGARMAWDDYRFEVTSPALGIPQWLYTVWLPLLSALIVVRVLGALGRWRRGND
ncbi:MAG: TRAP transporter small permease [Sterolibacteriaceae bacterium MAG5]|nr:TRAP transporter small permease [Candidatus Nitricoxidireducens bremensis]